MEQHAPLRDPTSAAATIEDAMKSISTAIEGIQAQAFHGIYRGKRYTYVNTISRVKSDPRSCTLSFRVESGHNESWSLPSMDHHMHRDVQVDFKKGPTFVVGSLLTEYRTRAGTDSTMLPEMFYVSAPDREHLHNDQFAVEFSDPHVADQLAATMQQVSERCKRDAK